MMLKRQPTASAMPREPIHRIHYLFHSQKCSVQQAKSAGNEINMTYAGAIPYVCAHASQRVLEHDYGLLREVLNTLIGKTSLAVSCWTGPKLIKNQ